MEVVSHRRIWLVARRRVADVDSNV
jgi:hypothetical protein